jgi:hydrogenase expression/formation protein HypC
MCLAVPGKLVECNGDEAIVDLQGNSLKVSRVLTPEANEGDWVLVHAGFTIAKLEEDEARETWEYIQQALGEPPEETGWGPTEGPPAEPKP